MMMMTNVATMPVAAPAENSADKHNTKCLKHFTKPNEFYLL